MLITWERCPILSIEKRMPMVINAVNSKTYEMTHQDQVVGVIGFPSMWDMKSIALIDNKEISIGPKNIWKRDYEININGQTSGRIETNWKGETTISLSDSIAEEVQVFKLSPKGALNSEYVLTNATDKEMFCLSPKFQWRKMSYDYKVEKKHLLDEPKLLELLVYAVFSIQAYLRNSGF